MHEKIKEALKEIDKKKEYILSMQSEMYLVEELAKYVKTIQGVHNVRISVGWENGSIQGNMVKADFEDIRKTTEIRKWIRDKGFPAPKIDDYPELQRRTFTYVRKDKPNFSLLAFCYYGEGAVCKFIEVGKKEEPVYELKCG